MIAKRIFDIIFSALGLIILSPFLLIISLIIKLDSKGRILYRQTRIGKGGREFKIDKFRTMVENADKLGMSITVSNDNRVTKAGRFLRKFKLDELPQLINVFLGEMSFVGPRPEVKKYVDMYNDEQRRVLSVRPGITEYASIIYRNENELLDAAMEPEEVYINDIMPKKLKLNLEYIDNMSFWGDIKLIFKTIFSLFE